MREFRLGFELLDLALGRSRDSLTMWRLSRDARGAIGQERAHFGVHTYLGLEPKVNYM